MFSARKAEHIVFGKENERENVTGNHEYSFVNYFK
jgi:hypothetical protein